MTVPPVGAPRKGGTALKKFAYVVFWLTMLFIYGVLGESQMCAEMNYEVAQCQ